MARTLDQILVVDVESTCWRGEPPTGQRSEIIEIGIVLLDGQTLERHRKTSILVRPTTSEVSEFCTELTTLRPEDVADAPSFSDACKLLRSEFDSRSRVFASFGDYDRRQFQRQCDAEGVGFPFGPTHLNVKTLAALSLGWAHEAGMPSVLEALGLTLEGTHHRGHDDAWNIAKILAASIEASRATLKEI